MAIRKTGQCEKKCLSKVDPSKPRYSQVGQPLRVLRGDTVCQALADQGKAAGS